ncbi:hypothetical protein [Novosphingobium sp.]|uniref:hypothetical protein n=1 Tax=Novosphingobium sp. TaxID=1874826 RepID=UPI00334133CB
MANEHGTDGSPIPPHAADATAPTAAGGEGSVATIPAFPKSVVQPAAPADGKMPPPLKPDNSFRGIAALVADKRPILREVKASQPATSAPAPVREPTALQDDQPAEPDRPVNDDEPRIAGMKLPSGKLRTSRGRQIWFLLSFVAPVILGATYLFAIAPDVYVTEYRFSVRLPIPISTTPQVQGKSFLFDGNTTPGTDLLDNYTVVDYVNSRQAAVDLNTKMNLRDAYNRPFDPLSKVGKNASIERLAGFWQGMVYSVYDPASGLAVVRVKAYNPQDSFAIATNLVNLSTQLVNSIGQTSEQDSVRFAQAHVDDALAKLATMNAEVAEARRTTGFINPDQGQNGPVNATQSFIAQLNERDSQLKGQIAAITAQLQNPDAPQVQLLRQQLAANELQLRTLNGSIKARGQTSIADSVTQFEALQNRLRDYQAVLKQAINTLGATQAAAQSQRVYMTTYVKPTLPEAPLEPRRWVDMLIIVIAAAMAWAVGRLVENSIMEHG